MQKLLGLDEMYLSLDTGRTTGHAAGIAVFEPHEESRDELAFLRERVKERLLKLPLLRWRLRNVPLSLDNRYWVDGEVDLNRHVRRIRLPKPGTETQFHAALDRVMAQLLDRDEPLWQIYVVEGLAGGRYAYVVKVSHGLADAAVIWTIFDQLSDAPTVDLADVPIRKEPVGGKAEMLVRGVSGLATKPLRGMRLQLDTAVWLAGRLHKEGPEFLLDTAARLVPGELSKPLAALANRRRSDDEHQVASLIPTIMPPLSKVNGTVTGKLAIEDFEFSIEDLRRVGKIVDGTVNDALLAVISGAVRRYLTDHGGVPSRPLIAAAPISWRTGKEKERWANQVFMLFLPLATHLDSPLERLRFCQRAADTAKYNWDGMPSHLTRRASEFMPVATLAPMMKVISRIPGNLVPKLYNVSVSNVRGPKDEPVYGGAPMHTYYVYGFLPAGSGILLGGQSLGDRMVITATVCTDIVKDYVVLPRLIQESLDEMLELADATTSGGSKRARAKVMTH